MSDSVHIVAVGARTPLGLTAESSAAAVRAGIRRLTHHPLFVDRMAEPVTVARDSLLDPGLPASERVIELLATALVELGRKLTGSLRGARIPLFLGLPEARPGWAREQAHFVEQAISRLALPFVCNPIELFPLGHAAGMAALKSAMAQMRAGQHELCLIAGADSYLQLETLSWLDQNRQLSTSYHRGAFCPGEGAGAFAVASESAVGRLGLCSLARVRGIGSAMEARRIKTDTVCLGEGLTMAIRNATASLELPHETVDGILCDINGERYRVEEWGFVMLRLAEAFVDPTAYELPVSCWGDMGAASGPLSVVLATAAGLRGYARGSRYLLWNSSEGGLRTAALLDLNLNSKRQGVPRWA